MIILIIQARLGYTRLPNKVLKELNGVTLLKFQVERARQAKLVDKVIVATTSGSRDTELVDYCRDNGIPVFVGSENDVLSRYYESAKEDRADIIVRLTADCPLIDPEIIDKVVDLFLKNKVDFAANTVPPETSKFPDGSDVEVFSMAALERAQNECDDSFFREHVTFYFWKDNNGFSSVQLGHHSDYSKYRFTVDYPEDLEAVKMIVDELNKQKKFGHVDEIVKIIEDNSAIKDKNSQYYFGIGWKK